MHGQCTTSSLVPALYACNAPADCCWAEGLAVICVRSSTPHSSVYLERGELILSPAAGMHSHGSKVTRYAFHASAADGTPLRLAMHGQDLFRCRISLRTGALPWPLRWWQATSSAARCTLSVQRGAFKCI